MTLPLLPPLVVNGETIPPGAIAAEAQNHAAPQGKPGVAWRKAADAMAIRALLLQEARRQGIEAEPAELSPGRRETADEALIRGLLDRAVRVARPDPSAVRAEYDRDPRRFRSPPLWEVSHILCACDPADDTARRSAHARALALTGEVLGSPGAFATLAARESDCGSRASGGALGQLGPDDTVPEFEAALRRLGEGEITPEPVLTRHGWHIVRMDARAEGRALPFEAVRDALASAMEKAAWARAARALVGELVEAAEISGAGLRRKQETTP